MPPTPWQISQTKYRRRTTTPISRKATRSINDNDVTVTPSTSNGRSKETGTRERKRQSTLTQIDFVRSSLHRPRFDDGELDAIPSPERNRNEAKKRKVKAALRDNTLTQMGMCAGMTTESSTFDDTMLEDGHIHNRVWVDGTGSDNGRPATTSASERKRRRPLKEIQERRPTKKRKEDKDELFNETAEKPARRSRRLSSAPVDTEHDKPLTRSAQKEQVKSKAPVTRPPLMIRDSTDYPDLPPSNEAAHSSTLLAPSTPSGRRRREVPSSQSPESIKSIKPTPSKRKICVLKLPKPNALPRSERNDDSQHDLWSLQATSPPTTVKVLRAKTVFKYGRSLAGSGPTVDVFCDDSPTKERSKFVAEDSLPDLAKLVGTTATPLPKKSPIRPPTPSTKASTLLQQSAVKLRAVGDTSVASNAKYDSIVPLPEDVMLLDEDPIDVILQNSQNDSRLDNSQDGDHDDEINDDYDLGSAVANDTQFVTDLIERLSSPSSKIVDSDPPEMPETTQSSRSCSRTCMTGQHIDLPPVPKPRLVQLDTNSASGPSLATTRPGSPLTPSRQISKKSVTKIPLNDAAPIPSSSTQPASSQQIFPASIPHPSQISTQAPSQGCFPSSSASRSDVQRQDSAVECITIDDSSSSRSHRRDSSGHTSRPQVEDSDDEELDLGATYPRHSTKNTKSEREEDETQTPTQTHKFRDPTQLPQPSYTQESPIILKATTRSQRDRELEVVPLLSSPVYVKHQPNLDTLPLTDFLPSSPSPSPRHQTQTPHAPSTSLSRPAKSPAPAPAPPPHNHPPNQNPTSRSPSPTRPTNQRQYLEGFNNETQSDYTQGGHLTAAFVHKCWEDGTLPRSFVPKPYKTGSRKW